MGLLKTAALAIAFGSLYTIFRKYQTVIDLPAEAAHFNQPLLQSFIIFCGMCSIVLFRPWMDEHAKKESHKPQDNKFIYFVPSLLDVLGTVVDTAGLFYTSVSVSQMLKGSALFFTYLITIFYMGQSLSPRKHFYMVVVMASLFLIGVSNLHQTPTQYQANPVLGNGLIILSQLLFSLMFIYEEKILKQYEVRVSNAVFWEGAWGVVIGGAALVLFSLFKTPLQTKVVQSCVLICTNWKLLGAVLLTALCIAPFNYFGISLTKQGSALQRCIICTARMVVVWSASLLFGWEQFSYLQLVGYLALTWAIFQFNQAEKEQSVNNPQNQAEEQVRLADELQG